MIITKTPLRISFAGGGTDLEAFWGQEEGAVLSSSLDLYVYLVVHRFFEPRIVLKYSSTETVERVDDIQHPLIRECMKLCDVSEPIEITSFADIPSKGSGLGSSSSFAVGLIKALYAFKNRHATAETCAAGACEVEIDKLGEPIGKQDQYAASYGGLNLIRFRPGGDVFVEPLIMPRDAREELQDHLVMYYTGITRSASAILSEQKSNTQNDQTRFTSLREMRDMAYRLRDELNVGNLGAMGEILHEGWLRKRGLASKVSSDVIDEAYQAGIRSGATGGKLLGAGGGGFLLFYCAPELHSRLDEALGMRRVPFRLESQGSRLILWDA